ncbi:MAG TPA: CXXX repeat peptide modification system protein [Clostridia bacterium]
MSNEKVGQVTTDEKIEVLKLFQRKLALNELMVTMSRIKFESANAECLYEKIVNDLGETIVGLENWWKIMQNKYQWKSSIGGQWNIDFDTNEIYLGIV